MIVLIDCCRELFELYRVSINFDVHSESLC